MKRYPMILLLLAAVLLTGCGAETESSAENEAVPAAVIATETEETTQNTTESLTEPTTKATTEAPTEPATEPTTEPPTEPPDTTPPIVLNAGWNACIKVGSHFDLNEHVGFADDLDPAPVLTWSGYIDPNVVGFYPLTATATDAAGNSTSWDLRVEVGETIRKQEDNSPPITFDTLKEQYAGENVRFGIDVSKWQGNIDFQAVKEAGCSFVIMRMGYFYDEIQMDAYYLSNMQRAKEAGLDVGVYLYTTANTEEEVRQNAAWIAENLNGMELDFPVAFDWESFSNFQKYGMSLRDLNGLFELFCDEMEGYGYSAMLYGSKNYLENIWYPQTEHPVWLAHYVDQTNYEGDYFLWQMSSHGRIHGITGDVDFNILYTDKFPDQERTD